MASLSLAAQLRTDFGHKTRTLRLNDLVPGVVYGSTLNEPIALSFERRALVTAVKNGGETTIIQLALNDGRTVPALVQDYQTDPMRGEISHIDFLAVDLTKPVEADIPLEFVGESMAIKALGGTLVRVLESIEVRGLPGNLPHAITVSIESLQTFEDVIRVSQLTIPAGIEVLTDLNESIAVVAAPRSDAELASLNSAVNADVSAVEVAKEKKAEDTEGEKDKAEKKK